MSEIRKPWALQKSLEDNKEIPTEQELLEQINNIDTLRDRAFVSLVYISAARIGEIVRNSYHKRSGVFRKRINIVDYKDNQIMTIKLRNEKAKSKKKKWKIIPINLYHDIDGKLAKHVIDYIQSMQPDDVLFPFGACRAWQIINKEMGFNPHWLRHIRLSHLCHQRDYNEHNLMSVAGWTDARPSSVYVATKWQDVADKELI